MKTTADDRLLRALKLLEAAHHPKAGPLLASRGFDQEALAEGWALLDRALGRHCPTCPPPSVPFAGEKELLRVLDAWENTWFDVADAALNRKAPAIRQRLFDGLTKRQGRGVLVSVADFLDRLDALERQSPDAPDTATALSTLAKRGLDRAQRTHARALLAQLQRPSVDTTEARHDRELAREQLWAWTKDWAKTARTAIADRRLCISIGLSRSPSAAPRRGGTLPPLERTRTATGT